MSTSPRGCGWACNNKDALSAEEALSHVEELLHDTGLLEGLMLVHGKIWGRRRYLEMGRMIHLEYEEAFGS